MTSRVPVLMYHRIGDHRTAWDTHYSVAPERFAAQMQALAREGYVACDLGSFLSWMHDQAPLPEKSILITFDDGFCGVHDHALPVLRDLAWPFVVFVVTDKIGQPADWAMGKEAAERSRQLMSPQELEVLQAAACTLQSHSASHADLTTLSEEILDREMTRSKEDLQAMTGESVCALAYPYGRCDERVFRSAHRAGYTAGFGSAPGFNRADAETMALRRLDVYGSDTAPQLIRKVTYGSNDGSLSQDLKYFARRLADRLSKRSRLAAS